MKKKFAENPVIKVQPQKDSHVHDNFEQDSPDMPQGVNKSSQPSPIMNRYDPNFL